MGTSYTRRQFLKSMGAATAAITVAGCMQPTHDATPRRTTPAPGPVPMRSFGSTGAEVSLLGLGGQATLQTGNESASLQIINRALDLGVNYIDTAFIYGSGRSENYIGQVMATRRGEAFLATKSNKKSYSGVLSDFDTSCSRLQTDYIDLYQVHNIGTSGDVSSLFSTDAQGRTAIDAFMRLRDEGRARFIGITGHHDPDQLLAVLNDPRSPNFDAILMALNPADWHTKPFQEALLPEVISRGMAIIAMKVTGMNYLLDDIPDMRDCLNYVYSFPISCAIVGVDNVTQLEQDVQLTNEFAGPLTVPEMQALETQTTGTESGGPRRGDWFKIERY